jgi:predicted TIM-barrel fold metal-dependent hydrolase
MRIDVHAHYFPTDYVDYLADLGLPVRGMGQATDVSGRLATLDANEVDAQVLSAVGLDTQIPDPVKAAKAARYINDELQFAGLCFPCFYQGKPLDDPDFEPFWSELDKRSAVAYVHPVGQHSCCHHGLKDFGLHTAYGSPLQVSTAATRIIYSGVQARYPNIKFVFAVCGGYLPFMWSRLEKNLRRGLDMTATAAVGANFFGWVKKLPLDHADPMSGYKKFWYDTSVQDVPHAMLLVKESYGADRLVLGSDEIFASLTEAVAYIKNDPYLSEAEKTAILDENAQKLLQLKPF